MSYDCDKVNGSSPDRSMKWSLVPAGGRWIWRGPSLDCASWNASTAPHSPVQHHSFFMVGRVESGRFFFSFSLFLSCPLPLFYSLYLYLYLCLCSLNFLSPPGSLIWEIRIRLYLISKIKFRINAVHCWRLTYTRRTLFITQFTLLY